MGTMTGLLRVILVLGAAALLTVGVWAAAGHGEWLYTSAPGAAQTGARNALAPSARGPSAYRWTADAESTLALRILIYDDDYFHPSPHSFVDQALQYLGLSYTAHYNDDYSGFLTDLTTNGPWDLVILGAEDYGGASACYSALNTYIAGGGKAIIQDWAMSDNSGDPLWTTLGVTWWADDYGPADVYWWVPSHAFFTTPFAVPQFTSLTGNRYGTYGQYVQPLSGFQALAGYTGSAAANQAALVVGNSNRTVFKGFMDGQNDADLNGNGHPDGMELWVNMICSLTGGSCGSAPTYDLSFLDDLGRSSLCLSSTSGNYLWKILKGTGAGTSYTGTGHVTQTATRLTLTNAPGAAQRISLNYYKVSKSASGYCQSSAQYSCLVDANTANDPACQ